MGRYGNRRITIDALVASGTGVVAVMFFSLGRLQRAARWMAFLLAAAIPLGLLVGGAQPFAVGLVPAPWDKLAHMAVYAVLACAIGFASRRHGPSAMLIGFVGAPWTLAAYSVEGGHSKLCTIFKRMCLEDPALATTLLDKITDSLCVYASHQVRATNRQTDSEFRPT